MTKAAEDRDEFGNWAWDARAVLGLSTDWVANEVGYSRPSVVKAEGRSRSRKMTQSLVSLYMGLARERGMVLPPPPGKAASVAPAGSGDLSQLLTALTRQTDLTTDLLGEMRDLRRERDELRVQLGAMAEQLDSMRRELHAMRPAGGAGGGRSRAPRPAAGGARP